MWCTVSCRRIQHRCTCHSWLLPLGCTVHPPCAQHRHHRFCLHNWKGFYSLKFSTGAWVMHYCEYQLTWKNGYNLPDAINIWGLKWQRACYTHTQPHKCTRTYISKNDNKVAFHMPDRVQIGSFWSRYNVIVLIYYTVATMVHCTGFMSVSHLWASRGSLRF